MGKKMSSFLLTHYTDSYFDIYQNNLIKMREKFIILKFTFIVLFILIGGIFLMQNVNSFFGPGLLHFTGIIFYYVLLFQSKFILTLRLRKI